VVNITILDYEEPSLQYGWNKENIEKSSNSEQNLETKLQSISKNIPLLTCNGHLATLRSNWTRASSKDIQYYQPMEFILPNQTIIEGLYREGKPELPLLIGSFGFLSDKMAHACRNFMKVAEQPALDEYNILILDHPTSAPFYCRNKEISWGGIEEGFIFVEVAKQMQERYDFETISIVGISMGGLGAIHAAYRGKGVIQSAMAFSAVTDMQDVPGNALRSLQSDSKFGPRFYGMTTLTNCVGLRSLLKPFFKRIAQDMVQKEDMINPHDVAELYLNTTRYKNKDFMEYLLAPYFDTKIIPGRFPETLEEYLTWSDATVVASRIGVPLYLMHAHDDHAVPENHYYRFRNAARRNQNIDGRIMGNGGHWGFSAAYGRSWVAEMIKVYVEHNLNPKVRT